MTRLVCCQCNRPAAWTLNRSPFCELHKERAVERHGVDRFQVRRLEGADDLFRVRGRVAPVPHVPGRVHSAR